MLTLPISLSEPSSVLIAGAIGAMMRVAFATGLSRRQVIAHLVFGPLMALFVVPWLVKSWFTGSPVEARSAIAFIVGGSGPLIAEIVMRYIENNGQNVVQGMAERYLGAKENEK